MRGLVKTRLARDVGEDAAFAAYEELLAATLIKLAPGRGHFAPEIWVEGDARLTDEWPRGFPLRRQPAGDLGTRMAAAFADGVCALVGCDIPELDAGHVDMALRLLAGCDVVIGPTEDGGYCLIAMNAPRPALFADIPWGTERVLSTTLAAANGLSVRLLAPLWDVDNGRDLARWRRAAAARKLGGKACAKVCDKA